MSGLCHFLCTQVREDISLEAILLTYIFLPAILFLKYINLIVSSPNRFNDPSLFKGRTWKKKKEKN